MIAPAALFRAAIVAVTPDLAVDEAVGQNLGLWQRLRIAGLLQPGGNL